MRIMTIPPSLRVTVAAHATEDQGQQAFRHDTHGNTGKSRRFATSRQVRHFPQWREFMRADAWRRFGRERAEHIALACDRFGNAL